MAKAIPFLFLLSISIFHAGGQQLPDTYRTGANPLYWGNRPPFPGYWQQDVHYSIKASLEEQGNYIEAEEKLTYHNNSPDTLGHVFFHLYQNAFQPGSYYDKLNLANKEKPRFGPYEKRGLGTEILEMKVNGSEAVMEPDNTILKVYLPEPLIPGGSIEFGIKFKTYFDDGSMRRRMKMFDVELYSKNERGESVIEVFKHYDGVHWYPRLAVYDRKFGWAVDQHLDKEFYGDFGTYDVAITAASNYILEATGVLQNRSEALPDSLRARLDLSNFRDKPAGEKATELIPYNAMERKTWIYHAENVHDFAFTADPTYRIAEEWWNGVQCIGLAQEEHATGWQNSASYAARIIQSFSEDIGMYVYPKIIVADARDGMEYPMLTLDGGSEPGYHGLLVHEVGHNWFYGQVGNNETYRAFLDEGFTQFLTAWGLTRIDGIYPAKDPEKHWYLKRFRKQVSNTYGSAYRRYLPDAMLGNDAFLNTHSSDFQTAIGHGGGYSHVYFKTAVMLYNLQYVLGDELFLAAMKHYFDTWKICHPYPEDFRNSVIRYTRVDLNWFFDQWLETVKNIDYKVGRMRKGEIAGEYDVTFIRKGSMQMPIDFTVVSKEGIETHYHIPNTWFVKKTEATVLPRWYGWGKLQQRFTVKVAVPSGIRDIRIDPAHRLADVYLPDNSKRFPATFAFDSRISNSPDWTSYEIKWRPDIWYNAYDGAKAGIHFNGGYMEKLHMFSATGWVNTGWLQGGADGAEFPGAEKAYNPFSFNVDYSTWMRRIPGVMAGLRVRYLDGAQVMRVRATAFFAGNNSITMGLKSVSRPTGFDLNYDLYPVEWTPGLYINTLEAVFQKTLRHFEGHSTLQLSVTGPAPFSDYSYSYFQAQSVTRKSAGKFSINLRLFGRYGSGSNIPGAASLYASGASPVELLDNKFTRAKGIIPEQWGGYGVNTNHFQAGGGLNLRGYAGYLTAEPSSSGDTTYSPYKGHSGASLSSEIDFGRLIRFSPKIFRKSFSFDPYLFGDIGLIGFSLADGSNGWGDIRMDAGIGFALTVKKFWVLEDVQPLTVRLDVPVVLSHTPFVSPDYFINDSNYESRWVIGVGRAF